MTKIVWIASYPRSGNTWMRFLVAHLLHRRIENSAQLGFAVPDIHRFVTGQHLLGPAQSFIKTHWRWQDEFPLRENTERVIYLIRDPLAVMESSISFALRSATATAGENRAPDIERHTRALADQFIDQFGLADWSRAGFGNWEENAASWIETELPFPRLVVRFEDLRADPVATLRAIASFAGIEVGPARLETAVRRSSLERLSVIEENEARAGMPGLFAADRSAGANEAGFHFIGGARKPVPLTDDERARAQARFAPAMRRFGYA
ncbi:MAG: sulfotransferase domain-containing protein [Rhodospirillaceae bacterium]|nr:sulfotransferase domain-containing protein [Rhodospirillaceae bacterium]